MNRVELVGRLTKDVEIIKFGKGDKAGKVGRCSIAVRDGVDGEGNERVQFINFAAWNRTAEILEGYTKKGDMVALCGKIVQNDYEDDDGVKHYSLQVMVDNVELLPNPDREEKEKDSKPNGKYRRG